MPSGEPYRGSREPRPPGSVIPRLVPSRCDVTRVAGAGAGARSLRSAARGQRAEKSASNLAKSPGACPSAGTRGSACGDELHEIGFPSVV
jgi:hypothetical protein